MPPCDLFPRRTKINCGFSFNPCFSGCRPATIFNDLYFGTYYRFNPCFSGCRPATYRAVHLRGRRHDVSILVLMDAALRHWICFILYSVLRSFNPCFSGCRPATPQIRRQPTHIRIVSILVLVDAALRHDVEAMPYGNPGYDFIWFQSLFWWMPPCDHVANAYQCG